MVHGGSRKPTLPLSPTLRRLTRTQAIDAIRAEVLKLVDDDHSICQVAGKLGIFCRGFRRLTDEELRGRFDWYLAKHPLADREQIEAFGNRWQLARQFVQNGKLACDVQMVERDTCAGWDEFSNATLERFHREIVGETVCVDGDAPIPIGAAGP